MSSMNISNDVNYTEFPDDLIQWSVVLSVTKVFLNGVFLAAFYTDYFFSDSLMCRSLLHSNFLYRVIFQQLWKLNLLIPFSIFQCSALEVCKTGRKESCRKEEKKSMQHKTIKKMIR